MATIQKPEYRCSSTKEGKRKDKAKEIGSSTIAEKELVNFRKKS